MLKLSKVFLLVICSSLITGLTGAAAQALTFGVSVNSDLLFEPEVRLSGLEFDNGKLGLRLAGGLSGPLELGVTTRTTQSFGPIGNIIFYGQGDVTTEGDFQVALSAEGVIASVAASVKTSLFTTEPGAFDMTEAYQADARPFLLQEGASDFGLGLALSARYRVSRSFIVSGYPEFYLSDSGGAGLRVRGEGRLVRLNGPDDLYLLGLGYLNSAGDNFGAVGAEYALNPPEFSQRQCSFVAGLQFGRCFAGGACAARATLARDRRSLQPRFSRRALPHRHFALPGGGRVRQRHWVRHLRSGSLRHPWITMRTFRP